VPRRGRDRRRRQRRSLLGTGFPAWTGGVLQCINGYEGGLPGVVARARELARQHGERFQPASSLVDRANRDATYTDAPALGDPPGSRRRYGAAPADGQPRS
jgi:hypothetical protein